jgi:hypothetical protein
VIAPLHVFVPEVLLITPVVDTPVPTMLIGSVTPDNPPDTLIAAPEATDVDDRFVPSSPRAVLVEIASAPLVTVVTPVYVFEPDRVSVVDAEFIVTAPAPEITPDKVWFVEDVCENVVEPPRAIVFE